MVRPWYGLTDIHHFTIGTGDDTDIGAGPEALMELIDEQTGIVCVAYPDF